MERSIFEVALEGDVARLKRMLHEDPLTLHRTMVNVYSETPLHIAAMLGHCDFTKKILEKNPKLAKELDSKKSSPLHLAAAKGHVEVVRALLLADDGVCKARDRDGLTPVHLAAVKGRLHVLKELIGAISTRELTDLLAVDETVLGESILHMCVRHSQLEALKIVVERIGDGFVNCRDTFGNTILHLAVADKQIETVKYLLQNTAIEVNAQNWNGLTAMDSLLQTRKDVKEIEIGELLKNKGAKKIPKNKKNRRKRKISRSNNNNKENWVQKTRDGLLVAASLLATMAFQSVVSPPGGLLQDNRVIRESEIQKNISTIFSKNRDSNTNIAPAPSSGNSSSETTENGIIGKSVMSYYKPLVYEVFLVANTTSFLASLSIILLLISGLPLSRRFFMYIMMIIMWAAIIGIGVSYFMCINMITPDEGKNIGYFLYIIGAGCLAGLAVILTLGHIIQMIVKTIKWLSRAFRKKASLNSSSMDMDPYHEIDVERRLY